MFFKTDDGKKILRSRQYKYLSGNSFISFKVKDPEKSELVFEIVHKQGNFTFSLIDNEGDVIAYLEDPRTGTYRYRLEVGKRYKINIKAKAHSGGYTLTL